ncbi:hypothetical protein QYF61_005755 [Mycteria americana]|uniref:Uncharacterized protein n=1 Tax=Mycteria americana TaxID=33587 RepID=A0AAN7NF17_MYCAM|nr:hypothetical protein QYF61_005755 [Mycteria americana]
MRKPPEFVLWQKHQREHRVALDGVYLVALGTQPLGHHSAEPGADLWQKRCPSAPGSPTSKPDGPVYGPRKRLVPPQINLPLSTRCRLELSLYNGSQRSPLSHGVMEGPSAAERGCFTIRNAQNLTWHSSRWLLLTVRRGSQCGRSPAHPTPCMGVWGPAAPCWGQEALRRVEGAKARRSKAVAQLRQGYGTPSFSAIVTKSHHPVYKLGFTLDSGFSPGTFKGHLVQPPCNEQGHLQLDQVAQSPSKLTLNVSRDGASTTSLGNLFHCFTTLIERCSSLLIIFMALLWIRSNRSMSFLCSKAGCSTPAQDTVGLLACKHTLLAHIQLFTHQYPQVVLCRAALNPFTPQPVLILGLAPTQVRDLALGLVEPHEVYMGPLLKLVPVPLDGIPSLRHANLTIQLGVICELAEGVLNPTVYVIDEDIRYLTSRSRLSHGSLLPSFPDFLHLGIESSCALWKASLKICQLCSAPLSPKAVSQGGPDFTLLLTHIPQDCELHQCMITAAQAASNLDVTN